MKDLIAVAAVPSQTKDYASSLEGHYVSIIDSTIPELSNLPKRSPSGRVKLEWEEASKIMLAQMAVKKRLEYGKR